MRLAFFVPAGFLAGSAVCTWMLHSAPHAFPVDRAQPLAVVTYWHQFGSQMWLALALAIAIASVGYVTVLRGAASTSLGVVRYLTMTMGVSAFACAAALLFPVVFSSDVYAYAGYGYLALHGISPYAHARITMHDPLMDAVIWQWGNPPPMCVYGPVFVWLSQAVVAVFLPLGTAAPLWALRILACIALVACAPLAYAAFAPFPRRTRLAAAAGIALNPIAIWSAAEGHNDTLALAIVLSGFALAARSRAFTGALLVALSALIKAPGALAAIALSLWAVQDRPRVVRLASGTALGLAIVAALAIPLEYGVRSNLVPQGHYLPQFSPQYVSIPLAIVVIVASISSAALRYLSVTEKVVYLAFAAWCAIPNPYPWYAVWLIPLAFLAWRTPAAWALIAASLLIVLRYYPDATTPHFAYPPGAALVAIAFGIPLAMLIAHIASERRNLGLAAALAHRPQL